MSEESPLRTALTAKDRSRWTGEIQISKGDTSSLVGSVFLYLGKPYAVNLVGYVPPLVSRLRSAGILDETCMAMLEHAYPNGQHDLHVSQFGVDQGWLSVERLGEFHSEFMLAGLGALVALPNIEIAYENGAVTDQWCALPVAIDDLIATLDIRTLRTQQAWESLPGVNESSIMKYVRVSPLAHPISELVATAHAMDGSRSIDEVAFFCGYTRAEVAFLTAVLNDEVAIQKVGEAQHSTQLLVPEGCNAND
jgi:hypothetical protein